MDKEYNELEDTFLKIKNYLFYSKKIIFGLMPTIAFSGVALISLMLHFPLDFKNVLIPISLASFITLVGSTYVYKEIKKRRQSKINLRLIEEKIDRLKKCENSREMTYFSEKRENNNAMLENTDNVTEKICQKKVSLVKKKILKMDTYNKKR